MDAAYLLAGLGIGIIGTYLVLKKLQSGVIDLSSDLNRSREEVASWRARAEQYKVEADKVSHEQRTLIAENATYQQKFVSAEEKLKDLNVVKENLSKEFENLANRILKE